MSAKRAAGMDSKQPQNEPRHFKQTTLNFGLASQQHRKKPKPSDEKSGKYKASTSILGHTRSAEKRSPGLEESPGESISVTPARTEETPKVAVSNSPTPLTNSYSTQIRITDKVGDLFDAPPNSVLIHACNAIGSWGGGIALAFRDRYPDAYRVYNAHCKRSLPQRLIGTALLIAPRDGARKQHYIGCLFTSKRFGTSKDSPDMILQATGPAMQDLLRQISGEQGIGEIRMCRINSGLFAVPWAKSKKVIQELELDEEELPDGQPVDIVAYSPD